MNEVEMKESDQVMRVYINSAVCAPIKPEAYTATWTAAA